MRESPGKYFRDLKKKMTFKKNVIKKEVYAPRYATKTQEIRDDLKIIFVFRSLINDKECISKTGCKLLVSFP